MSIVYTFCNRYILFALLLLVPLAALGQTRVNTAGTAGVFDNIAFSSIGPAVAGGRVTSVTGIPGNPEIYYVGTAGGGVWKSTDGGYNWAPIFNNEPTSSISDVVLDPGNPSVVWVATGETNPRNDVLDGAGLFRSTDAGQTWQLMGFKDAGNISKVVVDPHNSNVVWVSVFGHMWGPNPERGVFKTTDGGKTWKKVLFVNDQTGAIDLRVDGSNSEVLFAAMWQAHRKPWVMVGGGPGSGLWRSTDGGDTWTKLTNGIPKPPLGRISVAPAQSNPERVYALIQALPGNVRLFESNDLGSHWRQINDDRSIDSRGMYYTQLYVAPHDENKLFSMSFNVMESDDGGQTWRAIQRDPDVHVDQHTLWVDPDNPDRMINGNDGGVYLSLDGGMHWRFADTLPIEQFYQVATSTVWPYLFCGGLQDNNAWCGLSPPLKNNGNVVPLHGWFTVVGGDGMFAVPAPSDPNMVYADAQEGNIVRYDVVNHTQLTVKPSLALPSRGFDNQKYRFNWTSPIAVSPTDANTLFIGANVVFKSMDGGADWSAISPDLTRNNKKNKLQGNPKEFLGEESGAEHYNTLLSLVLAPTDSNVIWTGSDDGLVHVTRDGGAHWSNVTPAGAPQSARVYKIGVSPFDTGTAYVPFDDHEMDDRKAYVYVTDNYGQSWRSIAAGLPDEPVNVVREDPNQKGFLVLGNMTGLWYSRDNGANWQKFGSGFPTAPVFDVKFVNHDLVVATHGRGLFVLDNLRPFEEMDDQIVKQSLYLFTPSVGIQYTGESMRPTRQVMVDYYLKHALAITPDEQKRHRTPVELVITDSAGQPVTTEYGPSKAGINEFEWDMRYAAPTQLNFVKAVGFEGSRGANGPEVLPGTYRVAVTAGGETQNTTVKVDGDPALKIPMSVQQANLKFALQARNHESAFNEMLNRITAMQKTLEGTESAAGMGASLTSQAQSLDKKLTALKDSVYHGGGFSFSATPLLDRDLASIGRTGGFGGRSATVSPPAQELANADAAWKELDEKLGQFNALLTSDVVSYNKAAFAAGAATLVVGNPIQVKPVSM